MTDKDNYKVSMAEFKGRTLGCLQDIKKDITDIKENNNTIHSRINKQGTAITKLEVKTNIITVFQSGLTLIASSIAGYLGIRR